MAKGDRLSALGPCCSWRLSPLRMGALRLAATSHPRECSVIETPSTSMQPMHSFNGVYSQYQYELRQPYSLFLLII